MSIRSWLKEIVIMRAAKRLEVELAPEISGLIKNELRKLVIQIYKKVHLSPYKWDDFVLRVILIIAGYDPDKIMEEAKAELEAEEK